MTDTSDDLESFNVAATLRDIAANSDKVTGKILKKAERAAHNGESYITVVVSREDNQVLVNRCVSSIPPLIVVPTPLIEKLESLGFKLSTTGEYSGWSGKPIIKVSW